MFPKKEKDPGDISLKHPFFWSSFFVVDQPRLAVEPPNQMPGAKLMPGATPSVPPGGAAAPTPASPAPAGTSATPGGGPPTEMKAPAAEPAKPSPEGDSDPKPKVVPKKAGGVF